MLQNQTVDLTKERLLITVTVRPEPRFEFLRMRRLPVVALIIHKVRISCLQSCLFPSWELSHKAEC